MNIVIVGHFDLHADDMAQAQELVREMTRETRKESGCLHYAFAVDVLKPNRLQLSERWVDAAALDGHFQTPHMAAFRGAVGKLRIEGMDVKRYEVSKAEDLHA